jgi:hypothetical protein
MNQNLWRGDRSLGFWTVTLVFLGFELILRTKLGDIYSFALAWGIVQQALNRRSLGVAPAVTGETILVAGYYAFGVVVAIFAVFAALNIGLRSVNNAWTFFQLP